MLNGELRPSTCFTEIVSMKFSVGPHDKLSFEFYFDSLPSIINSTWYEIQVRFKKIYEQFGSVQVDDLCNLSNTYTRVIQKLGVAQFIGACQCFTPNHSNLILPRPFYIFKIHFDIILSVRLFS